MGLWCLKVKMWEIGMLYQKASKLHYGCVLEQSLEVPLWEFDSVTQKYKTRVSLWNLERLGVCKKSKFLTESHQWMNIWNIKQITCILQNTLDFSAQSIRITKKKHSVATVVAQQSRMRYGQKKCFVGKFKWNYHWRRSWNFSCS